MILIQEDITGMQDILLKMLKQINTKNRELFLQLFAKELILNTGLPELPIQEEAQEKIQKRKIKEENKKEVIKKKIEPKPEITKRETKKITVKNPSLKFKLRKRFTLPLKEKPTFIPSKPIQNPEFELGKLGVLLSDREITVIECPGPDEFLLVKKAGKVNLTKIKLSQEDIDQTLDDFSAKARIPLMEGVFKAIVGDLSINAVIINSAGKRFMIYKKTPYSFIER